MSADLHSPGKCGQKAAKEHLAALDLLDRSIGLGYRAVFVSSGEEGISQVFWTTYLQAVRALGKTHIALSRYSGRGACESAERLEPLGVQIKRFDADLKDHLSVRTALISSPVACGLSGKVISLEERAGAFIHVDITDALGAIWIDFEHLRADYITYDGMLPGVGALFVREGLELEPLIAGSEEQRGWRAGAIDPRATTALADEIKQRLEQTDAFAMEYGEEKALFSERLCDAEFFPSELPHILVFGYAGLHAELLAYHLDALGVHVSFGGGRCQTLESLTGSPIALSVDLRTVDLAAADMICEVARSLQKRLAL